MRRRAGTILFAGVLAVLPTSAQAVTIVGGLAFNDNAFADALVSSTGNWIVDCTGGTALAAVVTGSNPDDCAFISAGQEAGASLVLAFLDNTIVNGPGNDLAIFELGIPESVALSLSVGGPIQTFPFVATGFTAGGFNLNVALVDLTSFGILAGGSASLIQVFPVVVGTTSPSLTVFGALNSGNVGTPVPEPSSTFSLLTLGITAVAAARQRVRRRSPY